MRMRCGILAAGAPVHHVAGEQTLNIKVPSTKTSATRVVWWVLQLHTIGTAVEASVQEIVLGNTTWQGKQMTVEVVM